MWKIISAVSVGLIAALVAQLGYNFMNQEETSIPVLPDRFWGPSSLDASSSQVQDKKIYGVSVTIPESVLTDLKTRLKWELNANRLQAPLEEVTGFQKGFNSNYLKTLLDYWLEKYDWRVREKLLNKYGHFYTKISGLDIHFQHVKSSSSKYKKTFPLLLLHGWPGSFVQHQKVIPYLTDPADSEVNFEVVVASLPGFAFSQAPARAGLGPAEMTTLFVKLMSRLGHEKFFVHGNDWGSLIGRYMGIIYSKNVLGVHSITCNNVSPQTVVRLLLGSVIPPLYYSKAEYKSLPSLWSVLEYYLKEDGHFVERATKPETLGVGLSLSPSALAAYILEKFSLWTNPKHTNRTDGGLTQKFTLDELLDNVMIYWVTNTITPSIRLASEDFGHRYKLDRIPLKVPVGCLIPPNDPRAFEPKSMAAAGQFKNILTYTRAPDGGHFLGFEQPELLAQDLLYFVSSTVAAAGREEYNRKNKAKL